MNDNIKVLKLVNGEHYIGKVQYRSELNIYTAKNTVSIDMQPTQTGSVTVGFLPVSYFIESGEKGNEVTIKAEHVLHIDKPSKQIYDAYNQQFGSGLIGTTGPGLITE